MMVELEFNGKTVVEIEIDDIDTRDYPDFCDAYISCAAYDDGTLLTEEELVLFEEKYEGLAQELAFDYIT